MNQDDTYKRLKESPEKRFKRESMEKIKELLEKESITASDLLTAQKELKEKYPDVKITINDRNIQIKSDILKSGVGQCVIIVDIE